MSPDIARVAADAVLLVGPQVLLVPWLPWHRSHFSCRA